MFSFCLLLTLLSIVAFISCGKKKLPKSGLPLQEKATVDPPAKKLKSKDEEKLVESKEAERGTKNSMGNTNGEKPEKKEKEKKDEKKKEAEKIIADAIKAGDLLPPDDNETIDDCKSNWGTSVTEEKKQM